METPWRSHGRYHCAIDTPMEERIDPVEMNNDPCRPAGSIPRKGRCMKCAKTLTAARAMISDVVTHNKKDGRWRCRHCDDRENKKEEQKGRESSMEICIFALIWRCLSQLTSYCPLAGVKWAWQLRPLRHFARIRRIRG